MFIVPLGPKKNQIWNFSFSQVGWKKSKAVKKEERTLRENKKKMATSSFLHERFDKYGCCKRRGEREKEKKTDFNGGDSEATGFEDESDATCCDSFTESTHYSSWNYHILHLLPFVSLTTSSNRWTSFLQKNEKKNTYHKQDRDTIRKNRAWKQRRKHTTLRLL